jgi:hypothetical protein
MQRKIILLILAGVISLACVAPVMKKTPGAPVKNTPSAADLVSWSTPTGGGAVADIAPGQPVFCAKVTAMEALTVRDSPGVDGAPVGWLLAGDLVRLAGPAAGEWWPVDLDGRAGWGRSAFLELVECEEVEP